MDTCADAYFPVRKKDWYALVYDGHCERRIDRFNHKARCWGAQYTHFQISGHGQYWTYFQFRYQATIPQTIEPILTLVSHCRQGEITLMLVMSLLSSSSH